VLANFGERYATARILSLIAGGALAGIALLVGLVGTLLHLLAYAAGGESASKFWNAEQALLPFAAAGLLGLLFLWPAVQRAVARILPIRPGSPVIYLTVVLGLLLVAQQLSTQVTAQPPLTYGELLAQDVPLLILAFVGVGIFIRRSPRETIDRLALLPPAQKRWWLVSIIGIGVFMTVAFGIEAVANVVAPSQQKQVTDVTTVLFSHFNNPAAIIFLGVLAGVVEETGQHVVGLESAEIGRHLSALRRDGAPIVHRDAGQARATEFQVQVGCVAVLVGDMQEDVLAAHRVWFHTVEFIAHGRRDLEPRCTGAHDRIHLGGPQPAGRGVVGAGGTGVRVGAGQNFPGVCQSVLGDDLMADAMPADVIEALDAEVRNELSRTRTAGSVLDGRRDLPVGFE